MNFQNCEDVFVIDFFHFVKVLSNSTINYKTVQYIQVFSPNLKALAVMVSELYRDTDREREQTEQQTDRHCYIDSTVIADPEYMYIDNELERKKQQQKLLKVFKFSFSLCARERIHQRDEAASS